MCKDSSWDKDAADALKLSQQFREYHHKALWEEEKHFTWLHSIILAAQIAVITRKAIEIESRALLLIVMAIIGLLFVVVALQVIRREGAFFVEAHRVFVKRFNILFSEHKLEEPQRKANKDMLTLLFSVLSEDASIRDNFQFVFLVFGAIDAALIIGVFSGAV